MPRATQSRESGIVTYFKTADLPIALVVLGLAKEAVAERQAKSTEARARALKAVASAPAPKAAPAAAPAPKPKAKVKKRKAKKAKAAPAAQLDGPLYDSSELND